MEVELGQGVDSGNQAKLRQHSHPQRAAQAHLSPEGNRKEGAFSLDQVKRNLKARERQNCSGKGRGVGTTLTGGTTLKSEGHSWKGLHLQRCLYQREDETLPQPPGLTGYPPGSSLVKDNDFYSFIKAECLLRARS